MTVAVTLRPFDKLRVVIVSLSNYARLLPRIRLYSRYTSFDFFPSPFMKKLSLLLGALGGAMAGYVFSNNKLRDELAGAKDAETAGKILAKHLQQDGKQIGKEVQQFVQSDAVQGNVKMAKKYANTQLKKLKGDLKGMVSQGAKKAKMTASKSASKAKKTAKKAVEKVANAI